VSLIRGRRAQWASDPVDIHSLTALAHVSSLIVFADPLRNNGQILVKYWSNTGQIRVRYALTMPAGPRYARHHRFTPGLRILSSTSPGAGPVEQWRERDAARRLEATR
jgi:hypothetical protein